MCDQPVSKGEKKEAGDLTYGKNTSLWELNFFFAFNSHFCGCFLFLCLVVLLCAKILQAVFGTVDVQQIRFFLAMRVGGYSQHNFWSLGTKREVTQYSFVFRPQ